MEKLELINTDGEVVAHAWKNNERNFYLLQIEKPEMIESITDDSYDYSYVQMKCIGSAMFYLICHIFNMYVCDNILPTVSRIAISSIWKHFSQVY